MLLICIAGPSNPVEASWLCEGDLLKAEELSLGREAIGATAAPLPNTTAGTMPGDGVLLHWRGVKLQLPRTNNAGTPSYTDGRWWWQVKDPLHPDFRERRGSVITYACDAVE